MRIDELLVWLGWLRQVVQGYVASAAYKGRIPKKLVVEEGQESDSSLGQRTNTQQ